MHLEVQCAESYRVVQESRIVFLETDVFLEVKVVFVELSLVELKEGLLRCQGVVLVRDAVLAKRQTKRYPTYHADYAYQQALYSQMSPQYYQYGHTSPSPGTPQPYNYPQIGFTTIPRAGRQAPQLGALSPYIQQPSALINPSFKTPVPSSLQSLQLQPSPNPRAPVVPFSTLILF